MKYKLCFLLMIFLVSTNACAEVLSIDLTNASIEELLAARNTIEHILDEKTLADQYQLTGQGSETFDVDIVLPSFSRLVLQSNDSEIRGTVIANGEEVSLFDKSCYFENIAHITRISIKSKKPWILEASLIGTSESPLISGHGNCISDRFLLDNTKTFQITFDYTAGDGSLWNESCSLTLFSIDEFGLVHPHYLLMSGIVYEGKTSSFEVVAEKDPFAEGYFWRIECNSRILWTITE